MRVTREALVALHAKYSEMLRLRLANTEGGEEEPVARRADLASRFPGALREIDELPLEEIRARLAALDAAAAGGDAAPWMLAVWRFHELTRAILAAKRWIGARRATDDAAALEPPPEPPEDARPWIDDLARVARPPGGKLSKLVLERLGRELSVTPEEASALVFPWSRRRGLR
jgi:hypothetical protein